MCRWLDGTSIIYADNVQGISFDPPNQIINMAGCMNGNYLRPLSLGVNVTDVSFAGGRTYMS
jgi:hypothetical protein